MESFASNTDMQQTNVPHQGVQQQPYLQQQQPPPQSQYYHQQPYFQQPAAASADSQQQQQQHQPGPPTPSLLGQQQYGIQQPPPPQQQQQMPVSLPGCYAAQPPSLTTANAGGGGGGLPPMPEVAPMLGMYTTLLNNTMAGGNAGSGGGGGERNRQAQDLTKFETEPREALNRVVTDEMRGHWAQIEKLHLLDTERLDLMYTYQDTLCTNKKFLYTYLCAEYRQKYGELFQLYESLEVYMAYVLLVLIYQSESALKQVCESSNRTVQTPRVGQSAFKLRMFNRKRRSQTAGTPQKRASKRAHVTDEKQPQQQQPQQKAVDSGSKDEDHPFLQTDLYVGHRNVFKLGDMLKYCVPSEFAVMFCNVSLAVVNVFTQAEKKSPYKGVRVVFSRPVVSLVRSRSYKSINYQSLDLYGPLAAYLAELTGKSNEQEAFKLSTLKSMTMTDLVRLQDRMPVKWENNDGFHLTLVTFFNCTDTVAGVLNNRTYCSPVYHIPDSFVDASDLGDIAAANKTFEQREVELNRYYDRLEGLQEATKDTAAAASSAPTTPAST